MFGILFCGYWVVVARWNFVDSAAFGGIFSVEGFSKNSKKERKTLAKFINQCYT